MSDNYNNQEKREVSGFSALMFRGMGRIDLIQDDHEELVIEAQPEIRSRIKTEVREGTLHIDYDEDWKDWTGIRTLSGDKLTEFKTERMAQRAERVQQTADRAVA